MKKISCVLSLVTCLGITPALAMDDGSKQISKDYIAGFLAGARLTDGEIIKHFKTAGESSSGSDFLDRVFRTRIGNQPVPVPATYYAGFCIPEDKSHTSIIRNIADQLKHVKHDQDTSPDSLVYQAIKMLYPCRF